MDVEYYDVTSQCSSCPKVIGFKSTGVNIPDIYLKGITPNANRNYKKILEHNLRPYNL